MSSCGVRLSGVVLVVCAFFVAVSAGFSQSGIDDARFKRVNLVVADIDRSLKIYSDILGFRVDTISEGAPDSYSYPIFKLPKSAKLRFATLSGGDEQIRTFGLTEVNGMELEPVALPYRTATAIRVKDIKAVISAIKALGLETVRPHSDLTPEGVSFTEQAFYDYDGYMILLYELGD